MALEAIFDIAAPSRENSPESFSLKSCSLYLNFRITFEYTECEISIGFLILSANWILLYNPMFVSVS